MQKKIRGQKYKKDKFLWRISEKKSSLYISVLTIYYIYNWTDHLQVDFPNNGLLLQDNNQLLNVSHATNLASIPILEYAFQPVQKKRRKKRDVGLIDCNFVMGSSQVNRQLLHIFGLPQQLIGSFSEIILSNGCRRSYLVISLIVLNAIQTTFQSAIKNL